MCEILELEFHASHVTALSPQFSVYNISVTDIVQNGKNWIFMHNTSQRHGDLIAHYLLDRYILLLSLLCCMQTWCSFHGDV